jgi:photosystem II stability/assembly factor-like uncharacterized protein
MIKKVLIPAITAVVGIALVSGVYLNGNSQKNYKQRAAKGEQIPHSMAWARIDLSTGEFNPKRILEEKARLKYMSQRGDLGISFSQHGPDNVGGRTRAILELYKQPSKLLAGSVTGGLFVSNNGGGTWSPHNQFQNLDSSSSIISCIHEDTVNNIIYVGSGSSFEDSYGSSFPGFGVYKSTDGGATFSHITSTTPNDRFTNNGDAWLYVNRIRTNSQGHIFAATDKSLLRSTDGGATWENALTINGSIPESGTCADVAISTNDVILATMTNGRAYMSYDAGATFTSISADKNLPTAGSNRTCVTISPSNPDVMYIMYVSQDPSNCFQYVYKTTDAGDTWTKILENFPGFDPMLSGGNNNCQSVYDAAIHVSSVDPNTIYIGGIEIWRYDGNLTRIAHGFVGPLFADITPTYVHSDVHYITSSPNNPNKIYVGSDGGITSSTNNGNAWQGLNKGYTSTQFYDIAIASDGDVIIGGTQDNGTLAVLNDNANDPLIAIQVSGGDGFDCAISQATSIYFSTIYNGAVYRGEANLPSAEITGEVGTDFYTTIELWENDEDLTSKDSILFTVDPFVQSIATSNGIIRTYSETVIPVQPDAIIDQNSVSVKSGNQELTLGADGTTLEGDGTGTVTFNSNGSFTVQVTFDVAPAENSNVDVSYEVSFAANSILYVESKNMKSNSRTITIEHRLESQLNSGDQIKIQDPAQSMLASDAFGTLVIYRNVLNASTNPSGNEISIPGINNINELKFTKDGNTLFVGTYSGAVHRISGLQNLYTADDVADLDIVLNIFSGLGSIGGIAIDPNDGNRIVVTGLGFGDNRVRYSSNALSANPTFTNVHGNLPSIPVYDASFNVNQPNMVIIGTEFGVFATADITAGPGTTWSNESAETGYVPTFTVMQQQLPWNKAKNSGRLYLGTFGKGFYVSDDLVGINDYLTPVSKDALSELTVFPNPMKDNGNIKFKSSNNGTADITVYDLNGRIVKNWQERVINGDNQITFDTGNLKTGTYFMTLGNGSNLKTAKFMVIN